MSTNVHIYLEPAGAVRQKSGEKQRTIRAKLLSKTQASRARGSSVELPGSSIELPGSSIELPGPSHKPIKTYIKPIKTYAKPIKTNEEVTSDDL